MAAFDKPIIAKEITKDTFVPIPEGWYSAIIKEVDIKDTKAGTGKYLKMKFIITGPTHKNSVIFNMVNFKNANPVAERMGMQQLARIMNACGLAHVNDSDQFIGLDLDIQVTIKKDEQYGDQNEVKSVRALSLIEDSPF